MIKMSRFTPTKSQYTTQLQALSGNLRGTIMMRLTCETGIARDELANLKRDNLDKIHQYGLWIDKAKAIKSKKRNGKWDYEMRVREVPINSSLYTLLDAYLQTHTSPFILDRLRHTKDIHPLKANSINHIFNDELKCLWSPHDCRHYFRSQIRKWMIKERQMDEQVIKEMMGHTLDISERYGGDSDFEYKLDIVNAVFG